MSAREKAIAALEAAAAFIDESQPGDACIGDEWYEHHDRIAPSLVEAVVAMRAEEAAERAAVEGLIAAIYGPYGDVMLGPEAHKQVTDAIAAARALWPEKP